MPVEVVQTVENANSLLTIKGDGSIKPTKEYKDYLVDANTLRIPGESLLNPLATSQEVTTFLNRQEHTITIAGERNFSRITAVLDISQGIPVVYDTNFPVSFDFDNQLIVFFIGENPPNPLEISFTISSGSSSTLELQVSYDHIDINLPTILTNPYIDPRTTYTEVVQIPIHME